MLVDFQSVKILSSYKFHSARYKNVNSRHRHGFLIRIKGSLDVVSENKTYTVKQSECIFLPKGSSYHYQTESDVNNLYVSINFFGSVENPQIKVYSLENFSEIDFIRHHFSKKWHLGEIEDKYECISVFYKLLSHITKIEKAKSPNHNYKIIEPAIKYLNNNIFNVNFKIETLHTICGISDTYFRRIFKDKFSLTPQNYVLTERLNYAKLLLESAEFNTVAEVANLSGFLDPLYFSKAYKKRFGVSPSKTNNL